MALGWIRLRFAKSGVEAWTGFVAALIGFVLSVLSWLVISGEIALFHGYLVMP
jgi:hypothetical protein